MKFFKHRAWPGVLATACLLTGLIAISPIPVMNGQVLADSGPDLTIVSISWLPKSPSLRDTVTFTTTIQNQGDKLVPKFYIDYYIDDSIIRTDYVNELAAGGITTNTFTWQAPSGDHFIKAIIDNDNLVAETNENNNEKICAFTVVAADLIIESITWSPKVVSSGDTVTFTVKVKNRGNKIAGNSWVDLTIDGNSRGLQEYSYLEPDESTTITYKWITQSGDHTINATADFYSQVIESDETNNSLAITYSPAPPDLTITQIAWSPTNRTDTDDVTVHVTVKNKGTGTAHPSWLDFYVNEALMTSIYIDYLEAGAIDTKTYTFLPRPEKCIIKAVIDSSNWIYESDESNNTLSVTMPAVAPPDLLIQSITWTPAKPATNSWMTYIVTVKNAGCKTVDSCSLDLYLDYGYKINRKLGPITPGSTDSANFTYFTSTKPINVRGIVDPDNIIAESDETNNEKVVLFTPTAPTSTFDFHVTSLTCTPQKPIAGQQAFITVKIKNNGSKQAPESFLACYVDGVMVKSIFIRKISAGSTLTENITWIATPGSHTIRVVVDYNESVFEISEINNTKEIVVTTLSPDLAVKSITWSPEIPVKGDALAITFTITNNGTYKSHGCYISYYIDGSYLGNHYIEEIAPGGTDTRTLPWTITNDFQTFSIIIDEENAVIESNESNNEKVAVIPAPDLVIESITYSPTEFSENCTVTFTIIVFNTGVTPAASSYLDCYINNVFQASLPVPYIPSGITAELIFEWTALPGQNIIKAIVDGADNIVEVNETNNENSITIQTPVPIIELITPEESPEETDENATENETQELLPMLFDTTDSPPTQDANIPVNSSDGNIKSSANDLPLWQNVLGNKWIILGVGATGIAAIGVLLLLRKRAQAF